MECVINVAVTETVVVNMGQIVDRRSNAAFCAVLGSCVGAAIYHPTLKIGAMGHIVLPEAVGRSATPGKFADTAIPHMVSLLESAGADRGRMIAKIAGGASMFSRSNAIQIGRCNVQAVKQQLEKAGVSLVAKHVAGKKGRRVTFLLNDGRLVVELVGEPAITL